MKTYRPLENPLCADDQREAVSAAFESLSVKEQNTVMRNANKIIAHVKSVNPIIQMSPDGALELLAKLGQWMNENNFHGMDKKHA